MLRRARRRTAPAGTLATGAGDGPRRTRAGLRRPPPWPDPWRGTPTHVRALLTAAAGPHGRDLYQISGPLLEDYAERVGADLHVLTSEPGEYAPHVKWGAAAYFPAYERVAFIDADTVLAPDCPNLFELVPPGHIGILDERHRFQSEAWVDWEMQSLWTSQGWPGRPPAKAWNSGVWVADREHVGAFGPPLRPYPRQWCAEQWHVMGAATRAGFRHWPLPETLNWQWWYRKEKMVEPVAGVHIYHWSGLRQESERLRQMRSMVEVLYG